MAVAPVMEIDAPAARYEALIRISNSIRARKEPKELFDLLVQELSRVIPFDAIAQFDESANKVNWHLGAACQPRDHCLAEEEHEEPLPRMVYRTQETVLLGTLEGDMRFPAFTRKMRANGLRSVCAFPLTTAHRRLGSLLIGSTRPNAYSHDEVRFCSLVADQIALATDDAINFQASQQAEARLQLLLDLTNRVVSNLNLREVLREISAQVRRVMHCDGVGIDLPSPEDGRLRIYALDFGDAGSPLEEGYEPPADDTSPPVRAFRTGEPVIQLEEELQDGPARELGIRAVVHVPMTGHRGTVGVLSLGTRREDAFSQDDLPFLTQVAHQVAIAIENARTFGEVYDQKNQLAMEKLYLEDELRSELKFEDIVGRSEALRRVLEQIETVAPTESTVLIYGETGSGKELIARALHNLSTRKSGAFVKLNCAAIPTGLLESELFGHEKGAFTGAITQRIGRFELANRGTMFLDEIGEIPQELQPKLLRVLQEREFERLGSTRTLRTDARLIAATNRDLEALVKEQKFRPDLYYRLNVFPVRVPALRERPEDIPLLVRHFVQQYSRQIGKTIDAIPADTMSALTRYPWPGNIRELQNVIERAVILTAGPVLAVRSEDLRAPGDPPATAPLAARNGVAPAPSGNIREALEEAERQQILAALENSNWIVAGPEGAAARLGLKRSTLQSRMQKLGIRISKSGS
ncbi:MAG TPA: sigma 54-interacting transcriptional regulator [Candidatus Acidoferrales bacterium]|nr:sigma 54-interacting transcriptional regulator [Candidatus Acidoferrales bacterium]